MKKILLAFLICFKVYSQTISEIKYTGNNNVKYTCLLVYYNDDECYGRIKFTNLYNELHTVHIEYKGKTGKLRDGESFFALEGISCEDLSSNVNARVCYPNNFVWVGNEKTPSQVARKPELDGKWVLYEVDNFREINLSDLTPGYLKQFYNENDEDYKSLLKIKDEIILPKEKITQNKPTSLHLIVLANTVIPDIRKGCETDMINLDNEFKEISKTLNVTYKSHLIYGQDFSKSSLLNKLSNLNVNENDVIIFVYRGHGFRYDQQDSEFPSLAITSSHGVPISNSNSITLEEIFQQIISKNARLNIVLGDCCNSLPEVNQNTNDNYLYMQSSFSSEYEKLEKLFINSSGNLIFAASDIGEVSWTSPIYGGFFTTSFLQAMTEEASYLKSAESSWKSIINKTTSYAINKSSKCPNCTIQHAISKSTIKD
ncbi:caspase family protein [Flavobacterium sp.]|uniref:caspase family protein n=1 Tax=Flavobacterium sp. TaxID=239 RepID=UPI0026362BBB|nr:caspase family protein [Flavobacterium sp.]